MTKPLTFLLTARLCMKHPKTTATALWMKSQDHSFLWLAIQVSGTLKLHWVPLTIQRHSRTCNQRSCLGRIVSTSFESRMFENGDLSPDALLKIARPEAKV